MHIYLLFGSCTDSRGGSCAAFLAPRDTPMKHFIPKRELTVNVESAAKKQSDHAESEIQMECRQNHRRNS